jgi:Bromodomain
LLIHSFQYQTANAFLDDFELMRKNAVKFNGATSPIAQEAVAIYDFVNSQIEANRQEFTELEEAVSDMYSGKPKKKKAKTTAGSTSAPKVEVASTNIANIDGVAVNLGDLENYGSDDDSQSD